MKRLAVLLLVVTLALSGCGGSSLCRTLEGTWCSDIMTVTFNFENKTYSGVVLGESFSQKLMVVSEKANVLIFTSEYKTEIVCQLLDNGSIMLTKRGGIPVILTKVMRR